MIDKTLEAIEKYLENISDFYSGHQIDDVYIDAIQKDDTQKEGICITLLRVEEEISRKPQSIYHYKDGKPTERRRNPDICLNLYVLISAHGKYSTALTQISDVIYWMNNIDRPIKGDKAENETTEEESTDEVDINDLQIELQTLTAEQHNSLWQTLGGKMVPSVVYKVRMVTITSDVKKQTVDSVKKVILTRDSGFMSIVNERLHKENITNANDFLNGLTDKEKEVLSQEVIRLYAESPIQYDDIKEKEDDPEHLQKRKIQLNQWIEDEAWHKNEITQTKFNDRIRIIKEIQRECLVDALNSIQAKPNEEWTPAEETAYERAIKDKEFKKIFKI